MKKIISLLLAACMIFSLAACGSKSSDGEGSGNGKALKLGMYVTTSQNGIDATADGNGNAQTESTLAAVLLDENGVIVDCVIDMAQTKVEFTTAGEILEKNKELQSKRELGDAYGMAARAEKGEWYKQAEGFCNYAIGKTAKEISGIAIDESGVATDEAITATTTIKIGDFIEAVVGACESATELGAKEGDKLGVKILTSIADSRDAAADEEGTCYAYSTYCAVTVDKNAKVTSSIVDATESKINISAAGVITSDLSKSEVISKNVLKDNYGMTGRSEIGKEWYEQAAGFCDYIKGKTADEINGIAVNEAGKAEDDALLATTTIKIGDFIEVAAAAVADAE